MKLKKAISIFGEKHGKAIDGSEGSFDELLAQFAEEQNGGEAKPSEAEEKPADETQAEPKHIKKAHEHHQEKRGEPAFLRVLSTQRATIIRLALSAAMLLACAALEMPDAAVLSIKIAAAIIVGYDLVLKVVSDLRCLNQTGGALPVLVAALIYLCIGRGTEAVITLIVYHAAILGIDYVCRHIRGECRRVFKPKENGSAVEGDALDLGEGMTCPNDCVVIAGTGVADMSFLTGDKTAVSLAAGSFIPAGSVIVHGVLTAKVEAVSEQSMAAVIARTLLNGAHAKTQTGKRTQTTVRVITLSFLVVAAALMLLLPTTFNVPLTESLGRVAAVIAVAVPSCLLLEVPLTFFVGMTSARRLGIVFSKASAVEKTALIKSIVFDKVGTLTGREYVVSDIFTDKMDAATFLKVAAYAEASSDDPIAKAIVAAYGKPITGTIIENFVRYEGKGVSVMVDGINILLGSQSFLAQQGISVPRASGEGLAVHMTVNGIYAGRIAFSDYVIPTANAAVNRLYQAGVERVTMMSTDNRERDLTISKELGIDEYIAECPISDRPRRVKEMKARIDPKCALAYVSANLDAKECFAAADVGIAVGAAAQPRMLELADVTVMTSAPENVAAALDIAGGVSRYIRTELLFTIAAKLLVVLLCGFGFVPLYAAVLIDAVAAIGVILDCRGALRLGGNVGYGDFLR